MRLNNTFIFCLGFVLAASIAAAQDTNPQDPEKAQLRKELQELKQQQLQMQDLFEKRIKTLEDKLSKQAQPTKAPVLAGAGTVQFNGLIQGRFDTDSAGRDTFYIRRSELKLSGRLNDRADWTVMIDPAKNLKFNQTKTAGNVTDVSPDQGSNILQDAWLGYQFTPHIRAELGQQKIPFGYEALQPTSQLDVVERALLMSTGKYADVRDLGLQVKGRWNKLGVTAAVLNGEGESQNAKDANAQKAIGGRATYTVWSRDTPEGKSDVRLKDQFAVGVSAVSEVAPDNAKRERVGADIHYHKDKLTLRAEYAAALGSNLRGYGWYAHAGYHLLPKLEAIARFDTLNLDRKNDAGREEDWIGGINYFVSPNSDFQIDYLHKRFFNGLPINNQLFINYQVRW